MRCTLLVLVRCAPRHHPTRFCRVRTAPACQHVAPFFSYAINATGSRKARHHSLQEDTQPFELDPKWPEPTFMLADTQGITFEECPPCLAASTRKRPSTSTRRLQATMPSHSLLFTIPVNGCCPHKQGYKVAGPISRGCSHFTWARGGEPVQRRITGDGC